MIITIDGPVATGKSTIAKKLSEAIGFIFFDTGAMYRAVTYGILKHHVPLDVKEELNKFLEKFDFDIKVSHREKRYIVEKEDVTDLIRSAEVTNSVSRVSALKEIRDKLTLIQREFAQGVNAVFEGRDMGTVVFPHAEVKIFLTGRNDIRAKRRYAEIVAKYPDQAKDLTFEKCLEEINQRDHYDSHRDIAPLRQAEDAYVIDTSDLTTEEIVFKILEYKDTLKIHREPSSST